MGMFWVDISSLPSFHFQSPTPNLTGFPDRQGGTGGWRGGCRPDCRGQSIIRRYLSSTTSRISRSAPITYWSPFLYSHTRHAPILYPRTCDRPETASWLNDVCCQDNHYRALIHRLLYLGSFNLFPLESVDPWSYVMIYVGNFIPSTVIVSDLWFSVT